MFNAQNPQKIPNFEPTNWVRPNTLDLEHLLLDEKKNVYFELKIT